jgi:hypothetical protein
MGKGKMNRGHMGTFGLTKLAILPTRTLASYGRPASDKFPSSLTTGLHAHSTLRGRCP